MGVRLVPACDLVCVHTMHTSVDAVGRRRMTTTNPSEMWPLTEPRAVLKLGWLQPFPISAPHSARVRDANPWSLSLCVGHSAFVWALGILTRELFVLLPTEPFLWAKEAMIFVGANHISSSQMEMKRE